MRAPPGERNVPKSSELLRKRDLVAAGGLPLLFVLDSELGIERGRV